jgi:2-polyprenyl-3-methyl-5-hydroxy-6-metoxy-1,4-benzoquinol methylase
MSSLQGVVLLKGRAVRATKRQLSRILPYRPRRASQEDLDSEHAVGYWDYLGEIQELGRFSVVAGYCRHVRPRASILEIGCGVGLLPERLGDAGYTTYVGIDVSAEAIRRASAGSNTATTFIRHDAATYEPTSHFDLIVFNEVLEYFADPLQVVKRYENALAADGVFIVSMFVGVDTARDRHIWKQLASVYTLVDETRVVNRNDLAWTIKVLRPRHGSG